MMINLCWVRILALFSLLCATTMVQADLQTGCCCICGNKICSPEIKETQEEKICWKVECEEVCIPPIKFPWINGCQICCGGRVRTIRKMKAEKIECPSWEVKWTPVCGACRATLHRHRCTGQCCHCSVCEQAEVCGIQSETLVEAPGYPEVYVQPEPQLPLPPVHVAP